MTKDPIENLGVEGLRTVVEHIINSVPAYGEEVNFDLGNPENSKKIEFFRSEAKKLKLNSWKQGDYGVHFSPRWDKKFGFVFCLWVDSAFTFQDDDKTRTFMEKFEVIRKQTQTLKKARKYLARLIRLKEKLGLPGTVKEETTKHGENSVADYYIPLSQEMLDDILKH